jgi:hypothetical protein
MASHYGQAGVPMEPRHTHNDGNSMSTEEDVDVVIPWDGAGFEGEYPTIEGRYPIPEDRKLGSIGTAALIANNMIGPCDHIQDGYGRVCRFSRIVTDVSHRNGHFLYPIDHYARNR